MKTHTTLGRDAILRAEKELNVEVPFLRFAKEIAYSYQEKWDGSGYPEGLAGDNIPISARLMAVADVYDELISRRVYKAPMPHEQALSIINQGKGDTSTPIWSTSLSNCMKTSTRSPKLTPTMNTNRGVRIYAAK